LLKVKRMRLQEQRDKMEMMKQQMVAQQQMEIQQMSAQTAMMKIEAEGQSKMKIKQAEVAFEIERMKAEAALKQQLMGEEFKYNMTLAGLNNQTLSEREKSKEEAKAKRISQQNSEQSKLINQRKNDLPPINFESTEDTLDGFDLSVFEPR
jgi:hypothetical protein